MQQSKKLSRQHWLRFGLALMTILMVSGLSIVYLGTTLHPVRAQQNYPMGINAADVQDYSPAFMFTDVIKQCRGWGIVSTPYSTPVPVDAQGWPTTDAANICITLDSSFNVSGTYHLSFNGQATIKAYDGSGGNFTVANQSYNSSTNTTTATITLPTGDSSLWLAFTNTKRTASSATNTGVTNVKCIRPGYPADGSQPFTTQFLQSFAPFQLFRTMDLTATNNSSVVNWSDRTPPGSGTRFNGVSWEDIIQLANITGKDIWLNIPAQATDNYVTQLATLLKNSLNSGRHVYVEYSNEVWNYGFSQATYNQNQAVQDASLAWDGVTDQYQLATRRVGKRIVQISNLFKNVWGAAAINTTIRPVLAWQFGNDWGFQQQLDTINHLYGTPNQFIYGLAVAPYISEGDGYGVSQDTSSVDAIVNGLFADSTHNLPIMQGDVSLAHQNGLKALTYEGGTSTSGSDNLSNRIDANRDPRMTSLLTQDIGTNWFATAGGDFYTYYNDFSSYTQYGEWGLSETVFNQNTSKWQAIYQITGIGAGSTPTPTPTSTPTTTPTPTPTTTPTTTTSYEAEASVNTLANGAQVVACSYCSGGERVGYLGNSSTLQFNAISASQAGSATVTIYYVNGGTNLTGQMSVNGGASTAVNFPSTGNWNTLGTVTVTVNLQAGNNNTIKFSNPSGYLPDFDRLTVTTSSTAQTTTSYEAEASVNTLANGAQVVACSYCSGGERVGYLGNSSTLQFNAISASQAGSATVTIYYVNGGTNLTGQMSVNGGASTAVNFPSTGNWNTLGTVTVTVNLQAGNNNTIKFSNPSGYLPDFDRLTVTI